MPLEPPVALPEPEPAAAWLCTDCERVLEADALLSTAPLTLRLWEDDDGAEDVAMLVPAPVMLVFLSVGLRPTVFLKPS